MMDGERSNLVLIGMPGAGKSTVGVVAAKILGMDFVDLDLLIQRQQGLRLSEIMEQGVDHFLQIEEEAAVSLNVRSCVIAPGGSVIYGRQGMEALAASGRIFYLRLSYETLSQRLGSLTERGVALREGQTLRDLYAERAPLYEQWADEIIEEDGLSLEETVTALVRRVRGA